MLTTKDTKNTKIFVPADGNEDISALVVDAGFNVHNRLGPGLLESAYESCLAYELTKRNLIFEKQKTLPIQYDKNLLIDAGYRLDFLVNGNLIIELKSVERLTPLHEAQMLTYLKLSGIKTGLLINFNSKLFKDGIKRFSL